MTEDTSCLFINNGDDLLTLKKVVSKKSDKDDKKQKLKRSTETNGSELNGNHNKTDSINFDVDKTSSLEPNLEMDSDTDRNITIDSICTQEGLESENIDISYENSNEKHIENDIQVNSIKCSSSNSFNDNDSHDLVGDYSELNNIGPLSSHLKISAREPLHSNKDLNCTFEDDILSLEKEVLNNERKRKFDDVTEQEQKSTKTLKLWNLMKHPFQKITHRTSINDDKSNISTEEIVIEKENSIEPKSAICENNGDNATTEEKNTQNNFEADEEVEDTSINVGTRTFCIMM